MNTAVPWLWLGAAIATIAVALSLAIRASAWFARRWPDLHRRWCGSWKVLHGLAMAMAGIGLASAYYVHGLPLDAAGFAAYVLLAAVAAMAAYLAPLLGLIFVVVLNPVLLVEALAGFGHWWRHERGKPRVPPSDWLPPGQAKFAPAPNHEGEP